MIDAELGLFTRLDCAADIFLVEAICNGLLLADLLALLTLALTEFVRLGIIGQRDFTDGSLGTQP
jgi:hypothetical protein